MVRIIPQSDSAESIQVLHVVTGKRTTVVWWWPTMNATHCWHTVTRRSGPWPLSKDEREQLDAWVEAFAKKAWPRHEQVFPVDYQPPAKTA